MHQLLPDMSHTKCDKMSLQIFTADCYNKSEQHKLHSICFLFSPDGILCKCTQNAVHFVMIKALALRLHVVHSRYNPQEIFFFGVVNRYGNNMLSKSQWIKVVTYFTHFVA